MQELLVFILSVSGLSWIVTKSKVFKPLRESVSFKRKIYQLEPKAVEINSLMSRMKLSFFLTLEQLLNCYGCFGFWAGIVCYELQKYNVNILLYAFAGSISSLIIIELIKLLEKK